MVENPRAVVAVVAVPWKVGAVTVPINLPVPFTCKFAIGLSVPIPSNFETGLYTIWLYDDDMVELVPVWYCVNKRYWSTLSTEASWFDTNPVKLDPEPTKLVAVRVPETLTSPWTQSFDVGFVVPIPTEYASDTIIFDATDPPMETFVLIATVSALRFKLPA